MSDVAVAAPPRQTATTRIAGLDVARAIAMLGMVIVHFVRSDQTDGLADTLTEAARGRAMPLFMLLGGVGVSLLSAGAAARGHNPDRGLLIRAAILLIMGLILHEHVHTIAIVLQSYGLFFALAPLLRRLPSSAVLVAAAGVAVAGGVTYQLIGEPRRGTPYDELLGQTDGLRSLLFDGFYPFFPVATFFLLGIWLGRLNLRSDRVAGSLAGGGVIVGVGSVWFANRMVDLFDVDITVFGIGDKPFSWARLLDHTGHSQMLAWVVSAAGTSVAILGISILLAPRAGRWLDPVAALGSLALTFYVVQALLTRLTPHPSTTPVAQEYRTVAAIYIGFMLFAFVWKLWLPRGPFEALLRLGSRPLHSR